MNELITVSNVRGYIDENGVAQLNLEDVSRGLGFTQTKNGTEYVRWETVNGYLSDLGFSQLVGKEFIPENIFYRLAMKAKNEAAEAFQAKVADEILPAIRRTGMYQVKPMSQLEILAQATQALVQQEKAIQQLTAVTQEQGKQIETIKDTIVQRKDNWREWVNETLNKIAHERGDLYFETKGESYDILEERAGCDLAIRVKNMKARLKDSGACKTVIKRANKLDVIEADPRLKEIYTAIVKEMLIQYVA